MRACAVAFGDQSRHQHVHRPGQVLRLAGDAELAARHEDDVLGIGQRRDRIAVEQIGLVVVSTAVGFERIAQARLARSARRRSTRRRGVARRAMRARVGPILPPTPSTTMSPGTFAKSATSPLVGRANAASSATSSENGPTARAPVSLSFMPIPVWGARCDVPDATDDGPPCRIDRLHSIFAICCLAHKLLPGKASIDVRFRSSRDVKSVLRMSALTSRNDPARQPQWKTSRTRLWIGSNPCGATN